MKTLNARAFDILKLNFMFFKKILHGFVLNFLFSGLTTTTSKKLTTCY